MSLRMGEIIARKISPETCWVDSNYYKIIIVASSWLFILLYWLPICGTPNKHIVRNFILLHSYHKEDVLVDFVIVKSMNRMLNKRHGVILHTIRGTIHHHQPPRKKKTGKTPGIVSWGRHVANRTCQYVLIVSLLIHTEDNSKRTQHFPMRTKKWRCMWQCRND